MFNSVVDWVISIMETLGAPGVGIAILLENVFPPIPSEVVLPLAGFTASVGSINVYAAFIWATIGSVLGAYILYGVGAAIGANRLRKIADWMWLVDPEDVNQALHWFDKYGRVSIFFGRLIPGVRSLISIPAGIDRMNLVSFGLYSLAGSALWNAILIYLGYILGENWTQVEAVINEYSSVVKYLLVAVALIILGLLIRRAHKRKKQNKPLL
ncbi:MULTISPECIES: DedA family protein [unclassified Rothia (in: high G+C Gram-positive bacteria)]|uniref:DedA family protein n=1 Tax=unclassified Rothia (in: high G+C Gram-positive bacteria) TaxID=2689056 RepID=UPI0019596BCF|nr:MULTISPECIES: DedA family protein [unclassified Rothia (in: high G+C Gram-positive bacteria)]MBM7052141.1 DedA family protein [Rothia sp. ZJ1223]QRZ61425.1 DedA family protein [Rothia sp. ZJ932]